MSGRHLHDKNIPHTRHNHNLPSYAVFFDLVKAFDTVNYNMMLKILERYGAPSKLLSAISRMYQDLKVVLKIGKINEIHLQEVMVELEDPPLCTEYICAIQELTNDKSPRLNGVPPNAFKSMSE